MVHLTYYVALTFVPGLPFVSATPVCKSIDRNTGYGIILNPIDQSIPIPLFAFRNLNRVC
jgi:hypothetical protein